MALYPFILHKEASPSETLLNHERIHLAQQLELGVLGFYVWYLLEYGWLRRRLGHHAAYMALGHEREAYHNESNPLYLAKRGWFAFLWKA